MVTLVNNVSTGSSDVPNSYDTYTKPDTRIPPKPKPLMQPVCVNGLSVPEADILEEAQHHPAKNPGEALAAATRALVVKELLSQEARRLEISATSQLDETGRMETEEDAAIRILIDQEIDVPTATDDECRRYYENNRQRFSSGTIYEARHILLSASPDDSQKRKRARGEAISIINQLQKDLDGFQQLAKEFSACPSGKQGGNLGQITRGDTVAEFEAALQELQAGELTTQPVETPYGFHVIILDNKIDGQILPYEHAREKISAWLQAASWSRAVAQYVTILAGRSKIEGFDMANSDGPLVQ